jgi:Domain of unknown function (DUF4340)
VRPRTLLILAVLVVGLAAFIRFYERDLPSSDERAQRAKKVLDLKKDQVTRLRLEAGGSTVVLERQPPPARPAKAGKSAAGGPAPAAAETTPAEALQAPEWRITRPLSARADGAAIERLLDSLADLQKTRTLERVAPAAVGLDKPRAAVGLTVAGQRGETVLEVGAAVPTGGETIAAIAGRPEAYVISDSLLADVRKPAGDWRDRQLFHGDRDRIERLAWTAGTAPRVVLAKRGDRFWLESPIVDRADRDQVEKLLTDLTGLTAETFVESPAGGAGAAPPPPAAARGLAPPHAALEAVIAGQPQPFRVELGASHPAPAASPEQPGAPQSTASLTYARAGGTVFETRSGLPETLARPPADWRSPLLSGLEVHQVDAAVVRGGTGPLALTRSGTDWKRGPVTISYLPVSDLLFAITEAKADRLLTGEEAHALGAGAAAPLLVFELKGGAAGSETLTLYPPLAGAAHGVPARATGRDTVLLLPEAKLKEIQDRLAAVRSAPPLAPAKPAKK